VKAVVDHTDGKRLQVDYGKDETALVHRMLPSMTRPANPYDNATCESFLKTLKREEICTSAYRDLCILSGKSQLHASGY
jgi:putative transposase